MNKTELIDKIAAGAEITKAQAKAALEATTNALKEALIAGDKIQLVGFGIQPQGSGEIRCLSCL